LYDFRCGIHDVDTPHVTHSAHRADSVAFSCDRSESLAKPLSVLADCRKESRTSNASHDVICNGCDKRAATECSSMITRLDCLCNFLFYEHRTHRQSAGDGL